MEFKCGYQTKFELQVPRGSIILALRIFKTNLILPHGERDTFCYFLGYRSQKILKNFENKQMMSK